MSTKPSLRVALLASLVPIVFGAGAQAAAKPPTPAFGPTIEGFASYDAQDTCDPVAKPGANAFKDLILKTYAGTSNLGIIRACNIGSTSEHKEGRAWDWGVNYNNATQRDIAQTVLDWLLAKDEHGNACALARRTGMMYFIWNKQIWGAYRSPNGSCATAGWKAYTGTNPHTDHVHFSWAWPGAKKQTSFWTSPLPANEKPKGYLDGANCERVWGWAQDPDAPKKSIDVHLYFDGPAGDSTAQSVPIAADMKRDDLCTAIGSCNHGYEVASPLSLHDGKPHPVHAYGIDSGGGANAQLSNSPKTFTCAPEIPAGVRRHVVDGDSFKAWGFSYFWDVMPVDDLELGAVGKGPALVDNPLLVRETGQTKTWLIDGQVRRAVGDAAFATWDFAEGDVVEWASADLQTFPVGPPLRDKPILVQGSGPEVYLIDDDPTLPSTGGEGGASSGEGGAWGAAGGIGTSPGSGGSAQQSRVLSGGEEGCGCKTAGGTPTGPHSWWLLSALSIVLLRRRSR
ncbi:MAG: MYXO-CTERM sorting domain-containing protein [Polyangiaceae bacterium]